ncbi:SHOCT domain-containing protein [Cellulosimicrobium sp. TH-20]|uniref:SHOCT domain-containing protein n=1 Tax=Cellulosimicrobium sp. TH-20 TaxID=1980001 RepID=UPI0021043E28
MDRTTLVEVTVLGPVALPEPDLAELGVRRSVECTRLEARVRDQAALYGLLQRLAALGLDLVELRTAAPGGRPDVELVVRGPVGALVQQMLDDVGRAQPATSTTYRVRDTDLVGVLGAVTGLPDDRSGAHVGPQGGAQGGAHDPGPGGTAAGGASAMDVRIAQLRDLAALRDRGVLTDAELAEQKARVLEP